MSMCVCGRVFVCACVSLCVCVSAVRRATNQTRAAVAQLSRRVGGGNSRAERSSVWQDSDCVFPESLATLQDSLQAQTLNQYASISVYISERIRVCICLCLCALVCVFVCVLLCVSVCVPVAARSIASTFWASAWRGDTAFVSHRGNPCLTVCCGGTS